MIELPAHSLLRDLLFFPGAFRMDIMFSMTVLWIVMIVLSEKKIYKQRG